MTDNRRSAAEIQKELDAKIQRLVDLPPLIENAEQVVVDLRTEMRSLRGFHGGGDIHQLEDELQECRLSEQDKSLPKVVYSNGVSAGEVVDKVTAKRIFIRKIGYKLEDYFGGAEQFLLNGFSPKSYNSVRIDIRKTFNIDADSVPPNWKPETKKPPEES